MLIQVSERNRSKWNIGIVVKLIKGRDGVVRAIMLKAERSYLERAIQHLYPMKLSCDQLREVHEEGERMSHLNPSAIEFRPLRRAAIAAADKICLIAQVEANDTEH